MRRTHLAPAVFLAILAIPVIGWSKGETVKIEIRGDYLASPIEITDPHVVGNFSIWNGPGVSSWSHGQQDPPAWADPTQAAGRFIDWPKGWATDRPPGLQRVEVTFFVGSRQALEDARNYDYGTAARYIFLYEIDTSNEQGYVYLPRWKNELVAHFVEGNWFYASKAWDELLIPLIGQSRRESESPSQSRLACVIGTGLIRSDGAIELYSTDARGHRRGAWKLQPSDHAYSGVRELIGDVEPDEETAISCWPPRS